MKTIYLLRHGDYQNPRKVLPVRLPGFPLSDIGIKQIQSVSVYLKRRNIKQIIASPIRRTRESAQILGNALGVVPLFSKSLIEVQSPLQGESIAIIREIERYGDTFNYPPHREKGGETVSHIYARMRRMVKKTLRTYQGPVVFVSHGDPIMVLSLLEQGNALDGKRNIHSYGSYIPKAGLIRMDYHDNGKPVKVTRITY